MKYGIATDEFDQMLNVFRQHKAIRRVALFGSRALRTHRPGSDIDLAIVGTDLAFTELLDVVSELDELNTLYSFDIVDVARLTNQALLDHIHRVGISIYAIDEAS